MGPFNRLVLLESTTSKTTRIMTSQQVDSSEPPDGLIRLQVRKLLKNRFPTAALLPKCGLTLATVTPWNNYQRLQIPSDMGHDLLGLVQLSDVGLSKSSWSAMPSEQGLDQKEKCERWSEMEPQCQGVLKWKWEAIKEMGLLHIFMEQNHKSWTGPDGKYSKDSGPTPAVRCY